MKKKLKIGFFFGAAVALFLFADTIIDLIRYKPLTRTQILTEVIASLFGGLVGGFIYSLMYGTVLDKIIMKKLAPLELGPDETMVFQTHACHSFEKKSVGGVLALTNKRLLFRSHRFSAIKEEINILPGNIREVRRFRPSMLVNNGISIICSVGEEKFVVEKAGEWVTHLSRSQVPNAADEIQY